MAVIAEFELALREAEQAEGEPGEPDQILVAGTLITIADDISSLPMLRYAHALSHQRENEGGVTTVYAAAYDLLTAVIAPADWPTFAKLVTERKATYSELIQIGTSVYNHLVIRPTRRPSGSSGGSLTTTDASRPDAASRPDLAAADMKTIDDLT
jgi:hypothetical protein